MIEPRHLVMHPNTKDTSDFLKKFIKVIVFNLFRGTDQAPPRKNLQIAQLQNEFFPDVAEPRFRTILQSFARYVRGVWWLSEDSSADPRLERAEVTPEQVCAYQSMLIGLLFLRREGVNVLTSIQRFAIRTRGLTGMYTSKIVERIELSLMKTPWARADHIKSALDDRPIEMIQDEDGEQAMRGAARRKGDGASRQTPVAKTNADLRSLNLAQLREGLMEFGIPEAVIATKERWEQVSILRTLHTQRQKEGLQGSVIYARGPRNQYQAALQRSKEQYQARFDTSLAQVQTKGDMGEDASDLLVDFDLDEDTVDENLEGLGEMYEEAAHAPVLPAAADHPDLIPFGIATHPTCIDWDELGFRGVPRRPVVKLIQVTPDRSGTPSVRISWRRSPLTLRRLRRLPEVYQQDRQQLDRVADEDLEEFLLNQRLEKLITMQGKKKNTEKVRLQPLMTPDFALVQETREGELCFVVEPEIRRRIADAAAAFHRYQPKGSIRRRRVRNDDEAVVKQRIATKPSPLQRLNRVLLGVARAAYKWAKKQGSACDALRKSGMGGPVSITGMKQRAHNNQYAGLHEFEDDIHLLKEACLGKKEALAIWESLEDFMQKEINQVRGEIEKNDPSARRR
jgi:transcription initiation factor TFIID subunit 1